MIILKITRALSGGQILRKYIPIVSIVVLLLLSGCEPPVLGLVDDDIKEETKIERQHVTEKSTPRIILSEQQEEAERKLVEQQMESSDIQQPKRFRFATDDDQETEEKQSDQIMEKTEVDIKTNNTDIDSSQESNTEQSNNDQVNQYNDYQKIIEEQQKIINQLLNREAQQQKDEKTKRTEPKLKVDQTENKQKTETTLYINYKLPNNTILLVENKVISLYRSNQLKDRIYYAIEKTERNLSDKEIEQLFDIVVKIEELLQKKNNKAKSS
jgi:hypothetical protein